MPENRKIRIALALLLVFSALVRALVAGSIELGNDEVYYWVYAKYPDLSHFDHPPLVGLLVQATTLNLWIDHEFFIRLGPVLLGTVSTWLMFLIGKSVRDELTGFYAALLFTASFYGFILSGTFILPDTPQLFFWLLTLWLLLKSLPAQDPEKRHRNMIFWAGITAGLAFLSKYHSLFLPAGAFAFILFHNRRWFRVKESYMALFFFILLMMPVILWNTDNQFISFTFHENRVSFAGEGIQWQYLATEIAGQFFYQNPVNVVLIIVAFAAMAGGRKVIPAPASWLILWISLPLIIVFTGFSLFRSTLPHWSGPGYPGLILFAAAYLADRFRRSDSSPLLPWPVAAAVGFLLLVITLAVAQIRTGFIPLARWGDDVTHDLAGWRQLGMKFSTVAHSQENAGLIAKGSPVFTFRWFPAANFEYYVASPDDNRPVYALGTLERIHKYHWINYIRGDLPTGSDAWYLGLSDDYEDPNLLYGALFTAIVPTDTLILTRGEETVRKVFLFRMTGLKQDLRFPKPSGAP